MRSTVSCFHPLQRRFAPLSALTEKKISGLDKLKTSPDNDVKPNIALQENFLHRSCFPAACNNNPDHAFICFSFAIILHLAAG
jgi:hypothetical protein